MTDRVTFIVIVRLFLQERVLLISQIDSSANIIIEKEFL